jgi:hypothetical protein
MSFEIILEKLDKLEQRILILESKNKPIETIAPHKITLCRDNITIRYISQHNNVLNIIREHLIITYSDMNIYDLPLKYIINPYKYDHNKYHTFTHDNNICIDNSLVIDPSFRQLKENRDTFMTRIEDEHIPERKHLILTVTEIDITCDTIKNCILNYSYIKHILYCAQNVHKINYAYQYTAEFNSLVKKNLYLQELNDCTIFICSKASNNNEVLNTLIQSIQNIKELNKQFSQIIIDTNKNNITNLSLYIEQCDKKVKIFSQICNIEKEWFPINKKYKPYMNYKQSCINNFVDTFLNHIEIIQFSDK